jgi:hypothetical protein
MIMVDVVEEPKKRGRGRPKKAHPGPFHCEKSPGDYAVAQAPNVKIMVKNGYNTPHMVSRESQIVVINMLASGLRQEDIAMYFGLSLPAFQKSYKEEIKTAKIEKISGVATTLYMIAMDPSHPKCVSAGMFILRTQGGWVEKRQLEVTSQDRGLQLDVVNSRALTPEQRDALKEILISAAQAEQEQGVIDGDFEEVEES